MRKFQQLLSYIPVYYYYYYYQIYCKIYHYYHHYYFYYYQASRFKSFFKLNAQVENKIGVSQEIRFEFKK